MGRILIILKKENGPRASFAPELGLNTIIFKQIYWYMQQISGEHLQDHWSSGLCFSHCKAMEANGPRGGTIFDRKGMIGRIYHTSSIVQIIFFF